MLILRPIALSDLDALLSLASRTGFGLTTLPHDPELLRRRIQDSQRGFLRMAEEPNRPAGETYLFVLEDLSSSQVVGTVGIISKVGGFDPFWAYRIEKSLHVSETLGVKKEIEFLSLVMEHDGPCEIGSLFLSPDFRRRGAGRLLSLGRFHFMAEHSRHFDPVVIAEMRGVIDENGRSPFWESLGRHFFDIDFATADYQFMKDRKFIAELMPKHPIYIPLLRREAREVIGKVHEQTEPALKLLEHEGFKFWGMVNIFDGGPVVRCPLTDIRTVRESMLTKVARIVADEMESAPFVLSNARLDFRACVCCLAILPGKGVQIKTETAEALRLREGDAVRISPLRGTITEQGVPQ